MLFWLLPLRLETPEFLPLVLALARALGVGAVGVVQACVSHSSKRSEGAGSLPAVLAKASTSGVKLISDGGKLSEGCNSATARALEIENVRPLFELG